MTGKSESKRLNRNDLTQIKVPQYIVVEGPIGAGKTTLTKMLAETFNYDTLLEQAEANPFLAKFYRGEKNAALSTQLFFLLQRIQQLNNLAQEDMFSPVKIADFLIEKDLLFAEVILDKDELALYKQMYNHLTIDVPTPDLVIYLQAPANTLLERIHSRGITSEQTINSAYLRQINEAYSRFFHFYDQAPLLIINAADTDWINNTEDYNHLVEYMLNIGPGRHYYNPQSKI